LFCECIKRHETPRALTKEDNSMDLFHRISRDRFNLD